MQFSVIVDKRERNGIASLLEDNGIDVSVRTIPVGDFVISDRVCIERKTVSDFESSMMNGRLFDQVDRLRKGYTAPMLLIEGDRNDFRLKSRVINGAVAALYIDYGISVLLSHSPEDTAEIIASIARHEQDKSERAPSLKGAARARTGEQFQEYVIGNLPGVGPKLAKALLNHFKDIRSISNAGVADLTEVDGIGKKKAKAIFDTLNLKYDKKQ